MSKKVWRSKLLDKQGRYGASKCKGFIVLASYPQLIVPTSSSLVIPRHNPIIPSRELCIVCGIPYRSLARALPRWIGFGYVGRRATASPGNFEYQLTNKAKSWLRLSELYLPNHQLFVNELLAWQYSVPSDVIADMLAMPFLKFVHRLDVMIRDFKTLKIGA